MNSDDFENRLLDRRVQYCQFRIQQAISLIDDEIERLSRRLKIYNSQIFELGEKAQDLENQIRSAEISQDGYSRMRTADLKTILSKLKTRQNLEIQEIKEKYALEIESMQHDFANVLQSFNRHNSNFSSSDLKMFNESYNEREKMIQKEIEMYKSKIQTYNEAFQKKYEQQISFSNTNESSSFYADINSSVVLELTKTIEGRNKERYQSLMESKERMKECIEKMESMDREHKIKINNLTDQINSIEDEYQKLLSQLNDEQEVKITDLKNQLSKVETREKILSRAVHKLESENQKQLQKTKYELHKMESSNFKQTSTFSNLDNSQDTMSYYKRLKTLKAEMKQLMKKLHLKEEKLREKREENQALKREIGELKHEIRFTGRMVGSVFPYRTLKRKNDFF